MIIRGADELFFYDHGDPTDKYGPFTYCELAHEYITKKLTRRTNFYMGDMYNQRPINDKLNDVFNTRQEKGMSMTDFRSLITSKFHAVWCWTGNLKDPAAPVPKRSISSQGDYEENDAGNSSTSPPVSPTFYPLLNESRNSSGFLSRELAEACLRNLNAFFNDIPKQYIDLAEKNYSQEEYCQLCDIQLTTINMIFTHIATEDHLRKLLSVNITQDDVNKRIHQLNEYFMEGSRRNTTTYPDANAIPMLNTRNLMKNGEAKLCESAIGIVKSVYKAWTQDAKDMFARMDQYKNIRQNKNLKCRMCNIHLNSPFTVLEHCFSAVHLRKYGLNYTLADIEYWMDGVSKHNVKAVEDEQRRRRRQDEAARDQNEPGPSNSFSPQVILQSTLPNAYYDPYGFQLPYNFGMMNIQTIQPLPLMSAPTSTEGLIKGESVKKELTKLLDKIEGETRPFVGDEALDPRLTSCQLCTSQNLNFAQIRLANYLDALLHIVGSECHNFALPICGATMDDFKFWNNKLDQMAGGPKNNNNNDDIVEKIDYTFIGTFLNESRAMEVMNAGYNHTIDSAIKMIRDEVRNANSSKFSEVHQDLLQSFRNCDFCAETFNTPFDIVEHITQRAHIDKMKKKGCFGFSSAAVQSIKSMLRGCRLNRNTDACPSKRQRLV